jgi:hypothetical protein
MVFLWQPPRDTEQPAAAAYQDSHDVRWADAGLDSLPAVTPAAPAPYDSFALALHGFLARCVGSSISLFERRATPRVTAPCVVRMHHASRVPPARWRPPRGPGWTREIRTGSSLTAPTHSLTRQLPLLLLPVTPPFSSLQFGRS